MGKCWQIPASFKQEVIDYIETNKCSPHAAYVHFSKTQKMDYNESMYYQWYRNKEKIMTLNKSANAVKVLVVHLNFPIWKRCFLTKLLKCALER